MPTEKVFFPCAGTAELSAQESGLSCSLKPIVVENHNHSIQELPSEGVEEKWIYTQAAAVWARAVEAHLSPSTIVDLSSVFMGGNISKGDISHLALF